MSVDATRWAWLAPVKSSTQRLVLLSLADRAGEYHTCFPSVARITKDTKLNRKTIMKVIGELIELGLVEDTGHKKGATKQVIVYRLLGIKTREDEEINSTNIGTVPKTEQSQNYSETVPFLPHNSTNIGTVPKTEQSQNYSETVPFLPHNSTNIGTVPKTEQSQNYSETVPFLPHNSTNIGTQNLKGTKKESNNNIKFNFAQELKNLGAEEQLISDWLVVRKNKKAANTKTSFDGFARELKKSNLDVNTALKICVERNWQGFNSGWLNNIDLSIYQQTSQKSEQAPQNLKTVKGAW